MKNLLSSCFVFVLLAGAAGAQPVLESPLVSNDERVWITVGRDVFQALAEAPALVGETLPPRAFAAHGDGVVTRVRSSQLDELSELVHSAFHRCGGFMLHGSRAEAEQALQVADHGRYQSLMATLTVDQQAVVNPLLPLLDKNNILGTIDHLSTNYNNRYYQNASGEQAALWIRDLWLGYAAGRSDVTVETVTHSFQQPSVVMTIQGGSLASEVVVLGGHLDSIKSGATNTNPSTIAPGADDNASGIAALSEAARVLLSQGFQPDRTVKFMGYAAEEVGLRGSADIAAQHNSAGIDVVAVMQLDMTDFNGSVEDVAFIDDNTNAQLTAFTQQLLDEYQPSLQWTTSTCGYACSDHASWHNQGYAAVMPFEARFGQHNSAIHTSNDTLQTLGNQTDHALKFSKLALSFAVEIGLDSSACSPAAVANAGADRTICAGDSTQIGTAAQAGHSYSWSPGGGSSAQLTVSPSSTTTYTVTATTSCGSAQDSVTVTVDNGAGGGLDENFEGGLGSWSTSGLWHLVNNSSCASPGYSSASRAVYYGQDSSCNYATGGATSGNLISPVVAGINSSSTLEFDYFRQVESYASGSFDQVAVAAKATSSSSWTTLWSRDSRNASENAWASSGAIDLSAFAGQDIQVRFRFDSIDGTANNFTGWLVDDVVVTAQSSCGGGNTAPSVVISAPSGGSTSSQGQSVSFSGSASDSEDGNLSGSLAWASSRDGAIGNGASFSTSGLSVGSHTITASVTDSGGLSGSDTVDITVQGSTPSCSAEVDFSSGASGWINGSGADCSTGTFIAGTPTQQSSSGVITQVGGDHTSGSGNAFYTAANSSAGNADVDGGTCIAESPVYAVSQASDLSIWYFHGQRDAGDDSGDFFDLEISTDGGATYTSLVSFGDVRVQAAWAEATTTVPAGANVKLRLRVADASGPGDLVEGGVDDLTICPSN